MGYRTPSPSSCTHAGWTDERVELLKALWADGLSASQIATQLGGITRNAVIGKAHRMGLTGRGQASVPGSARAAVARMAKRRARPLIVSGAVMEHAEPRPPRAFVVMGDDAPGACTLESLGAHMCKWPIGDPQDPAFSFCGAKTEATYCDAHAARSYDRTKPLTSAKDLARSLRRYAA